MQIADSLLLSLFNEKFNFSHAPNQRLKLYSILNTKCIRVIDPEEHENYILKKLLSILKYNSYILF